MALAETTLRPEQKPRGKNQQDRRCAFSFLRPFRLLALLSESLTETEIIDTATAEL